MEERIERRPEPTLEDLKNELHLRVSRAMHTVNLRHVPTGLLKGIVEEAKNMKHPVIKSIYTEDPKTGEQALSGYTVEEGWGEK